MLQSLCTGTETARHIDTDPWHCQGSQLFQLSALSVLTFDTMTIPMCSSVPHSHMRVRFHDIRENHTSVYVKELY